MTAAATILGLFSLAAAGTPLFVLFAAAALAGFYSANLDVSAIVGELLRVAGAPGIIAIPLFTFAGYLYAEGNSAKRLLGLCNALIGWIPGGTGIVAVFMCCLFTALTGQSAVTIVALGSLLMPALLEGGYGQKFATGLMTTSGALGLLFLPSLPIIIYGIIAQTDIIQLFIGAALPGVLMIGALCLYCIRHGVAGRIPRTPFSFRELKTALMANRWDLPLPVVILVGIYGGFITVSEAAAVTATYALVSQCFLYREVRLRDLRSIVYHSMEMVGSLLIILGLALGVTNYLIDQEVPQKMIDLLQTYVSSKYVFLLLLNIFLLIVGVIMESFSAIVVLVPLVAPVAQSYHIHPVHLGILFMANLAIGFITPPVGVNLFVASAKFKTPLMQVARAVVPSALILLAALVVITYVPWLSTAPIDWIVGKTNGELPGALCLPE